MNGFLSLLLVLGFGTSCSTSSGPHPAPPTGAVSEILAAGLKGAPQGVEISYVWLDADGHVVESHNPDLVMHAASLMKVAVMVEVFRQVDAGTFQLDDSIPVTNSFRSVIDGSPYSVNRADDSDAVVHTWIGGLAKVNDLVEHMITRSSNLATNVLIEAVDARAVQATLRRLGISTMEVKRGVEDGRAFKAGVNNVTTANDMALLMHAIAQHRAATSASCARMVEIMQRQTFRKGIARGVPSGAVIASKTGSITKHSHDVAIVAPSDGPMYVVAVMTRGFEVAADAEAAIARVSGAITQRIREAARTR